MVSSGEIIEQRNKRSKYGRKYSWGVCDIENPEHSDFMLFYSLVVGYLSFQLISRTDTLFELYQEEKIVPSSGSLSGGRLSGGMELGFGIAMGVGVLGAVSILFKKFT